MPLIQENIRFFLSYLLALIKKVLIKFILFPTYIPVTLIKSKGQIHSANLANPDIVKYMEFIMWFLQKKLL